MQADVNLAWCDFSAGPTCPRCGLTAPPIRNGILPRVRCNPELQQKNRAAKEALEAKRKARVLETPKPAKPIVLTPEQMEHRSRRIRELQAEQKAQAQAGAEELGEPSLWEKGSHYLVALAKWTRAGWPKRTPEEAAACEAICRTNRCGLFDAVQVGCKRCGCKLSSERWSVASKTRMKTEHCPVGLW